MEGLLRIVICILAIITLFIVLWKEYIHLKPIDFIKGIYYFVIKFKIIKKDVYKASIWYLERILHINIVSTEIDDNNLTITFLKKDSMFTSSSVFNFITRKFVFRLYCRYEFEKYTFIMVESSMQDGQVVYNIINTGWIDGEQLEKIDFRRVWDDEFGNMLYSFDYFII